MLELIINHLQPHYLKGDESGKILTPKKGGVEIGNDA